MKASTSEWKKKISCADPVGESLLLSPGDKSRDDDDDDDNFPYMR